MRTLKFGVIIVLALAFQFVSSGTAKGDALGTEFTYQGRLTLNGGPVTDTCDFRFSL